MDDKSIVTLYWARDENAIKETVSKYGRLCEYIAGNILSSREDRDECVNDTWLAVWNAIPVQCPNRLSSFVGKITRNLALKKYDYISAAKRNASAVISLEELGDCVTGTDNVETEMERKHISDAISNFLWQQNEEKRIVLIRRYWYFDSIACICRKTGFSQSKVKSMLFEMRQKLRKHLEREGINI